MGGDEYSSKRKFRGVDLVLLHQSGCCTSHITVSPFGVGHIYTSGLLCDDVSERYEWAGATRVGQIRCQMRWDGARESGCVTHMSDICGFLHSIRSVWLYRGSFRTTNI